MIAKSIKYLVVLVTLGAIASWVVASSLVAPKFIVIGPPPIDLPGQTIALESESGALLSGWHFRVPKSKGVIILLHGIRANRLQIEERARLFVGNGYSVVGIDFQAHGESSGEQITVGYLEKQDVRAAVAYAKSQHPAEPVGIVGISLGGASALLASPLNIDALVLESVYPDIEHAIDNRVAELFGPLSYIPTQILLLQLEFRLGISLSELRPIDYIASVGCPVFIISGSADHHTTVKETQELFSAASHPKELWVVEGAAHVDMYKVAGVVYEKKLLKFFNSNFFEVRL